MSKTTDLPKKPSDAQVEQEFKAAVLEDAGYPAGADAHLTVDKALVSTDEGVKVLRANGDKPDQNLIGKENPDYIHRDEDKPQGKTGWIPPLDDDAAIKQASAKTTHEVPFEKALKALKDGKEITRTVWARKQIAISLGDSNEVFFKSNTTESMRRYVPTQEDILAEDWVIL